MHKVFVEVVAPMRVVPVVLFRVGGGSTCDDVDDMGRVDLPF